MNKEIDLYKAIGTYISEIHYPIRDDNWTMKFDFLKPFLKTKNDYLDFFKNEYDLKLCTYTTRDETINYNYKTNYLYFVHKNNYPKHTPASEIRVKKTFSEILVENIIFDIKAQSTKSVLYYLLDHIKAMPSQGIFVPATVEKYLLSALTQLYKFNPISNNPFDSYKRENKPLFSRALALAQEIQKQYGIFTLDSLAPHLLPSLKDWTNDETLREEDQNSLQEFLFSIINNSSTAALLNYYFTKEANYGKKLIQLIDTKVELRLNQILDTSTAGVDLKNVLNNFFTKDYEKKYSKYTQDLIFSKCITHYYKNLSNEDPKKLYTKLFLIENYSTQSNNSIHPKLITISKNEIPLLIEKNLLFDSLPYLDFSLSSADLQNINSSHLVNNYPILMEIISKIEDGEKLIPKLLECVPSHLLRSHQEWIRAGLEKYQLSQQIDPKIENPTSYTAVKI